MFIELKSCFVWIHYQNADNHTILMLFKKCGNKLFAFVSDAVELFLMTQSSQALTRLLDKV